MLSRTTTIGIGAEDLSELRQRLARTRWPDQPPGPPWQTGTDLAYLRDLVDYWRTSYEWPRREALLNRLRQFRVTLDGIDVHFIHQPGVGPAPMPLLLLHGWPSSIVEFTRLIPLLTDPAAHGGRAEDAFTVIAPSLPGFTLSFASGQPRSSIARIASTLATLMRDVLGYGHFAAHGGDWGAHVAARLAYTQAQRLLGIHLTMIVLPFATGAAGESADERDFREAVRRWNREESGYATLQATRPQTLAYALNDSPSGLAAWILEKFRAWSDCGGDLERRFSRDELLDNIMLYWFSGCINSSFWPYYARVHEEATLPAGAKLQVPTGFAAFPAGAVHVPRSLAERAYDIRRWQVMPAGGHFPALEEPVALAGELREFFRPLRSTAERLD
jgi:microsomal epoxide hydrolase